MQMQLGNIPSMVGLCSLVRTYGCYHTSGVTGAVLSHNNKIVKSDSHNVTSLIVFSNGYNVGHHDSLWPKELLRGREVLIIKRDLQTTFAALKNKNRMIL